MPPSSALARNRARLGPGPAAVYLAKLSPGSRDTMRKRLEALAHLMTGGAQRADEFPWAGLRYEHTQAVRSKLASSGKAPAYVNLHLSALRGVLKEAWRLQLVASEDYMRARDVQGVRGKRLKRGREVAGGELSAVFDSLSGASPGLGPTKARNAALMAVLHGGGLRRAEAVGLELRHLDDDAGTLRVLGKGNKERLVPLPEGALAALRGWLAVRGAWPGPLFIPVRKNGKLERRPMTTAAVYEILSRVARKAAVKRFAPHDLRRTYATALFRQNVDGGTVQRLMGHEKLETTLGYDQRGEEEKKKAVGLLHVPYRP